MTSERVELTKSTTQDRLIEGDTGRIFLIDRTRYTDAAGNVVSESVHRTPIEPDAIVDAADVGRDVAELRELVQAQRERADAERVPVEPVEPVEPRET